MLGDALPLAPERLAAFQVVSASDPAELDSRSRVSERLSATSRVYRYRLHDPALWRRRYDAPIFKLATRSAGAIVASYAGSSFATDISIDGNEGAFFCFTTLLQGALTMTRRGVSTTATATRGLAFRPGAQTRMLTSDGSVRTNVFIRATEVEAALEHMLDKPLRAPIEFRPDLAWNDGLAASLKPQLDFVMREFGRPDGLASNPAALAAMTDFLLTLVLRAVPHSYTDQLDLGGAGAVPAYVRRAEDFMHAHAAEPLRIAQVAAAAGCSVRTLGEVFRRFRATTPLASLHGIRLEHVRAELSLGTTGAGRAEIAEVARRYGFTNASRFATAFRRRFGEAPAETVRRAARG